MSWQSALTKTLETTYGRAQSEGLEWSVVGSAATALQGCRISPHDIDIMTRVPEHVFRFAAFMQPFAAAECAAESPGTGWWFSTQKKPVYVGSYWGLDWHFARWEIDDTNVEIVHIVAPGGHECFRNSSGVWECDPSVWPHIRTVRFAGRAVPVVPLEIQLETNMTRGYTFSGESLEGRIAEVVRVLRETGCNRSLLEWALREEHLAKVDPRINAGQSAGRR
jgi:hypothetical protein